MSGWVREMDRKSEERQELFDKIAQMAIKGQIHLAPGTKLQAAVDVEHNNITEIHYGDTLTVITHTPAGYVMVREDTSLFLVDLITLSVAFVISEFPSDETKPCPTV